MIRINLLPLRAARKKETAIQQIVIFCASLAVVLVVIVSMYFHQKMKITITKEEISTATSKITELKKKIGKLEELKTLQIQVRKKLDILTQLRKNKTGPAHRLATLSDITPDQLWLTSYGENGQDIKISGIALSEDLLAGFMRRLEASEDFTGVELIVSEQSEQSGAKLKRFELSCKLRPQIDTATKKP